LFFGFLIIKGKKIKAFNTFLKIKNQLKKRECFDPALIFLVALIKVTPVVILRPYKVSGVVYGVPLPITYKKQFTFACK
jgi:ribosomal protein S7